MQLASGRWCVTSGDSSAPAASRLAPICPAAGRACQPARPHLSTGRPELGEIGTEMHHMAPPRRRPPPDHMAGAIIAYITLQSARAGRQQQRLELLPRSTPLQRLNAFRRRKCISVSVKCFRSPALSYSPDPCNYIAQASRDCNLLPLLCLVGALQCADRVSVRGGLRMDFLGGGERGKRAPVKPFGARFKVGPFLGSEGNRGPSKTNRGPSSQQMAL